MWVLWVGHYKPVGCDLSILSERGTPVSLMINVSKWLEVSHSTKHVVVASISPVNSGTKVSFFAPFARPSVSLSV